MKVMILQGDYPANKWGKIGILRNGWIEIDYPCFTAYLNPDAYAWMQIS